MRPPKPLAGVLVVALEQAVSAPLCTRHLAEQGARVIKLERTGEGDYLRTLDRAMHGMCSHFVWANRGKESLAVDVKHPDGRRVVEQLMAKADVVVQNLAPGATERLGLDGATLARRHPSLVCCTISGYGAHGPYASKKAYDLLIQAETGLLDVTGTPDTPSKVGTPVADIASAMYAYSGILAALYRRGAQPGRPGANFDVSMLDALGDWMGWIYGFTQYGGGTVRRHGASHAAIAPYGPFAVGPGGRERVMLAVQSGREWKAFCATVLERPALAEHADYIDQPARVRNKAALQRVIEDVFAPLSVSEVVARLERAGIAYSEYRTAQDAASHPQWAARQHWGTAPSPVGPLQALRPVVALDQHDDAELGAVPDVGQHTQTILEGDLGFTAAQITDLARSGAVGVAGADGSA